MQLAELGKVVVVSPHLDDAVLSCGELIGACPGTRVLTVFAGMPPDPAMLTEWDRVSGFDSAAAAIGARREEDRRALALLDAVPSWLEFCDSQYRHSPAVAELAGALTEAIGALGPDSVVLPCGLFHSDHLLVHRAMMAARARVGARHWLLYGDALYRRIPGLLQEGLQRVSDEGAQPLPIAFIGAEASARKREAISCYASQLRALQATTEHGHADALAAESYWRLAPR